MRPDEALPRADADPGQAPARPPHPQVQSTGQAPAPKTTTLQQHNANNHSLHHTQAASANANIRRKQASKVQQHDLNQQQQQQQGEKVQQPPEAQLRQRQETEQEHHARKSSSSTAQSSASSYTNSSRSTRQQQHSTAEPSNYNFAAPMAIHDHLMQAAHHAQALQQRNAELEAESRILKEAVQQHKLSAIDWCMTAKEYQQDRNVMTLRLEELEMELARMAHSKKADKVGSRADKSEDVTAGPSTSSSSRQQLSKAKTSAQSAMNDEDDNDLDARHQFLSQSITQILDEMTPKITEPGLPIHGKAHNGGQNQDTDARCSNLPPTLKQPSKSFKCKCGCQEELRAWKTRCKYAENRAIAQELRCEQMIVYKDAYKTKWTQWREDQIQQQYQQRMRAAMPFNTSQYMSPFQTASLQQQYLQQQQYQRSLPVSSYEGGFKRARFASEGSETSSQRQERTERNTIYNQITTSFVPGGQAERRKSSTNIRRATGKGSAEEPHILIDRDEGSSSEGCVGLNTSPKRLTVETTVLDSSDGNDTSADYESSVMSPTFPSDMTLHLRQYQVHSEDDDEESDGYASPSDRPTLRGQPRHRQESPSTPVSRSHRKATSSREQQERQRTTIAPDSIPSEDRAPASSYDYASDRSSPPMFDTADFITQKASARSNAAAKGVKVSLTHQQTGGEVYSELRAGVMKRAGAAKTTTTDKYHSKPSRIVAVLNGERRNSSSAEPFTVYEDPDPAAPANVVLETPLELQGIRGDKPVSTAKAIPEVIEIAEDDHAAPGNVSNGSDGGGRTDVDVGDNDGGSDKENSPPEAGVIERRDSDGMMDFEETPVIPACRDMSPSKGNVPEVRIYNYTERRKNKRKLMHGHNCECCRRFYEITGPLPLPDGYSHFFQPIPRPGEKEVWERTDEERLQDRIQQVSRHRVHHMPPMTPPGYWDTDFPSTPERKKWDEIDRERRERKRQQESHQAEQQLQRQRYGGGGGSSSGAGPSEITSRSKF